MAFERLKVGEKTGNPLADYTMQERSHYYDNMTVRGLWEEWVRNCHNIEWWPYSEESVDLW